MRKAVFCVFLLLFLQAALSQPAPVLNYTEGDLIQVRPVAFDEDGDRLTYQFRPPLSAKGEWQTAYGDAGTYLAQVRVSDGKVTTVRNLTINVAKKEELPTIELAVPEERSFSLQEGQTAQFTVRASDLNKDPLQITWTLDGQDVAQGGSYLYDPGFYGQGKHLIIAKVTDGVNSVPVVWRVEVEDVDRSKLLDGISSVSLNETQLLVIPLPDLEAYDLRAAISEPVGDDGRWRTTYDDAGEYAIDITITDDRDFTFTKGITVIVQNVNRPPVLTTPESFTGREAETLIVPVLFSDPDGQQVLAVAQSPPGAAFNGTHLFWTPGYEVVTRQDFIDELARRYHLLELPVSFNVTATDGESAVVKTITLRIFNTNRVPVITAAPDITLNQGEPVTVAYEAGDPDGDPLAASFEGYILRNGQQAGEPGTHYVRLTVSDGLHTAKKQVKVTVNPQPESLRLAQVPPLSVSEGERIEVSLDAPWASRFSVSPMPEGAYVSGNLFVWEPGYSTITEDTTLNLTFLAEDGEGHADAKSAPLLVRNVNTLPALLASSQQDGKEFGVGEEIVFFVDATDEDGDSLSYSWTVNGDAINATGKSVALSFPSAGRKSVKAQVSDGTRSVARSWSVDIVRRPIVKLVSAPIQQPSVSVTQATTATATPAQLPRHEVVRFAVVHQGDQAPQTQPSNSISFVIE